ncbi:PspC domain-containing protein [Sphaerochaeta sp. PS]|uniref:PspC domain-containing protein n=1 Tax=Sphaerochaeta sp. PS TaxID=3076336 RepID=UPI0028A57EBA|nr:PspC domain-containing protein [Sphaerochaeta sp. PS]MDT4762620.1 PspC domain-containing protein [Sphaerochaeta sp. PS]
MESQRHDTRRLFREQNGFVLGVLAGLANWSGLPVAALRIIAVVLLFTVGFTKIGIIYLGAALLMPSR